ncbi:sulfite exporter TauE/SafE family protein [uncultured Sphingomonas sp.]|uniref:sulfite exporter TauE/SafE family protein n=1 Tax=uncultured Sphingomonas sp. TaxID=158754 RepID=UPI0025E83A2A|nr:sulfite exporter TauE/SafE family protein [uncultured Sphingomonas sp.]
MDGTSLILMAALMAVAAALYSSVGHGGASAYVAIMALLSVAPETMRPMALTLNLMVASLSALNFASRGQTNLRLLAGLAATAAPAAYAGGMIKIAPELYRPLVGLVLLFAAARLYWQPERLAERPLHRPSLITVLPVGAGLGLLAGLTGTGGGIFLSPLIILLAWEEPRRTSGVAAAFIFINSAAGLAGNLASVYSLPPEFPMVLGAVAIGAVAGTFAGLHRLPRNRLLQALGVVLIIAGLKLVLQ